eukprot:TRINITY_DN1073_c0_g1_i1.p1 TRINITY_DN1073_c0_g1~~TRINITY_DN1073_c0_g1_i1.p1  ORF type:complete len:781 (-),score=151.06 TRINITY_DN1073_c0_g1_i1:1373-3715(-)
MVVCYMQVVGSCTGGGTCGVMVFFDQRRYLFGIGEGMQRTFAEWRLHLSRVAAVFLPQLAWSAVGGLPGASLTVAESGVTNLSVVGPAHTSNFIAALRSFVLRPAFTVYECTGDSVQCGDDPIYEDELIRVFAVSVSLPHQCAPAQQQPAEAFATTPPPSPGADSCPVGNPIVQDKNKFFMNLADFLPRKMASKADCEVQQQSAEPCVPEVNYRRVLPPAETSTEVLSYICHLPDTPGKFDPAKAKALGIFGSNCGKLVKGETVANSRGVVVHPHECVSPPVPGPVFIIVNCPDQSYATDLLAHPNFAPYYAEAQHAALLECIVHFTSPDVVNTPQYKQWMNMFKPTVQHIIANANSPSEVVFRSSATLQLKLNLLHPTLFPLPVLPATAADSGVYAPAQGFPPHTRCARNLLKYVLGPPRNVGLDESDLATTKFSVSDTLCEVFEKPDLVECLSEFRASMQLPPLPTSLSLCTDSPQPCPTLPNDSFRVTMVGTGAALPSKYRNVSSTLVNLPCGAPFMCDCGEGTFGQLCRTFGEAGAVKLVSDLIFVFVSHIHADHHLGLHRIFEVRRQCCMSATLPPLVVVGPRQLWFWLQEFGELVDATCRGSPIFTFTDSKCLLKGTAEMPPFKACLANVGVTEMTTARVIHCPNAFGVVVTHKSGWKLVYSGDTRPCDALIEAGQGATLLIHEATLENSMLLEAQAKKHSTTNEAIEAAHKMAVDSVLLTHFSQRYPKVPLLEHCVQDQSEDIAEVLPKCTLVAFDQMVVTRERAAFLAGIQP